jgi:uncharacterized heparinase superfamily protein
MTLPPLGPPPPANGRDADYAEWLEYAGKSGAEISVSPVHRLRISGPGPSSITALASSNRPVNRQRGEAILAGRWRFGSTQIDTPEGHSPWGPAFPTFHFADRIHRFHWLKDLAACGPAGETRGRALLVAWTDAYGKWDDFAWRLGITADRLINFLSAGPWLFGPLEGETRFVVLDTLGRQIRHLQFSAPEETDPAARFRIAVALCLAGAATEDGRKTLEAGLAMLETECAAQILPDGGHVSRSPQALAEALLDIHAVEELILRQGVSAPLFLNKLQPRMAAMLSFFQTQDGGTFPSNGGGDCAAGLVRAALRPHGGVNSKFSFARLSAYQRVQAQELAVYIDAGPGPDRPHGGHAHAGALALTVDDGAERIITSCGSNPDLDPAVRDAARRTAAHSVLTLNGEDSAVFAVDPITGMRAPDGPAQLAVRRMEEGDQYLLEGQHAGWRVRHGLIYRRRLYVAMNGLRITGEDSLSRPMSEAPPPFPGGLIPFEIRFHLHPGVQIAPGPDERTVFLGLPQRQHVWRFRSETLLSVENSRYWGGEATQKSQQLVIRGVADPGADGSQAPNRVRWALSRVDLGGQGET